MRTREKVSTSHAGSCYQYTRYNCPGGNTPYARNVVTVTRKKTIDTVTPDFWGRKARGEILPVNGFETTESTIILSMMAGVSDSESHWHCIEPHYPCSTRRGGGVRHHSYVPYVPAATYSVSGGVMTVAPNDPDPYPNLPTGFAASVLQKALAKARTESWDISTFLAELHKTQELVWKVGDRTFKRAESIRASRKSGNLPYQEFLSMWMTYRYGWRILSYDIEGMNQSIQNLATEMGKLRSRYTAYEALPAVQTTLGGPSCCYVTSSDNFAVTAGGASGHTTHIAGSKIDEANIRAGVGLTFAYQDLVTMDPLVTLSEIIPYHLVVNWFINSKDLVNAWSPFGKGSVDYGFVTSEQRQIRRYTWSITSNGPAGCHPRPSSGFSQMDIVHTKRVRVPQSPQVNLRFRVNLDMPKLVDLAAILSGQYGRLLRGR